ncbi:MAG TPA: hypothetical protein VKB81_04675 [Nitrospira sp.]|nr:hypothetical protein [Nitrospira sp.]
MKTDPTAPQSAGNMALPRRSGRPIKTERKLDLVTLYKLRVSNKLSYGELARHFGVAKSTVHAALTRLNKLCPDPESVKAFEGVEATILTATKERLLASLLDEQCIQKASLNNRAFAFTQVANHERLIRGQSTHNIGIFTRVVLQADEEMFGKKPSHPL